jgi:EpsI family protein
MRKETIGYIGIVILLVITSFFSLNLFFKEKTAHDKYHISAFPRIVGNWKGTDDTLTEKEYAILETRNLISREYVNPQNEKLYLFIIYSETNRSAFHPPEVCMIGSGMAITDKQTERVDSGSSSFLTNKLYVEKGPYKELVLYTYKAGNIYTNNFYFQQAYLAIHQIFGAQIPGATIRVTMQIRRDEKATLTTLKDFLANTANIIK